MFSKLFICTTILLTLKFTLFQKKGIIKNKVLTVLLVCLRKK